jgi:3-deoxy-D-manno-octulosonic-acid transferase
MHQSLPENSAELKPRAQLVQWHSLLLDEILLHYIPHTRLKLEIQGVSMLRTIGYELLLWLTALLSMPLLTFQMVVHGKYRHSLWKRFGGPFADIPAEGPPLIWIHAVSVGEVKAVAKLAKELKKCNSVRLLVTTITETGQAEVSRSIPEADYCAFLPFDSYWIITPIVRRLHPCLVLICETDLWPNFLSAAHCSGASIALVNGKMSARSAERFRALRPLVRPLFELIDLYCLQSEHYRKPFADLGIPEDKIAVTGNLKFDAPPPELTPSDKERLCRHFDISPGDKVCVIGSTHAPEEEQLLEALKPLWQRIPTLKIIIVPRHPERFNSVEALMTSQPVPAKRFSAGTSAPETRLWLLDTMGMLTACYQIADVAVVAGSFTSKVGGHNILEPLWYGIPTLFGPHMESQPDLVALVNQYRAGLQLPLDQLADSIDAILGDADRAIELRVNSLKLTKEARGSTQKTISLLQKINHK